MNFDLICLDLDGTLCDRDSLEPYSYVIDALSRYQARKVIVTNQGGVGLSMWLREMEESGVEIKRGGDYPSREDVRKRVAHIVDCLGLDMGYISLSYRSVSSGLTYPKKADKSVLTLGEMRVRESFDHEWRKPNLGMIKRAMTDFGVSGSKSVLVVGDREEDLKAACTSGVSFVWADIFFNLQKG